MAFGNCWLLGVFPAWSIFLHFFFRHPYVQLCVQNLQICFITKFHVFPRPTVKYCSTRHGFALTVSTSQVLSAEIYSLKASFLKTLLRHQVAKQKKSVLMQMPILPLEFAHQLVKSRPCCAELLSCLDASPSDKAAQPGPVSIHNLGATPHLNPFS